MLCKCAVCGTDVRRTYNYKVTYCDACARDRKNKLRREIRALESLVKKTSRCKSKSNMSAINRIANDAAKRGMTYGQYTAAIRDGKI